MKKAAKKKHAKDAQEWINELRDEWGPKMDKKTAEDEAIKNIQIETIGLEEPVLTKYMLEALQAKNAEIERLKSDNKELATDCIRLQQTINCLDGVKEENESLKTELNACKSLIRANDEGKQWQEYENLKKQVQYMKSAMNQDENERYEVIQSLKARVKIMREALEILAGPIVTGKHG